MEHLAEADTIAGLKDIVQIMTINGLFISDNILIS